MTMEKKKKKKKVMWGKEWGRWQREKAEKEPSRGGLRVLELSRSLMTAERHQDLPDITEALTST